MTTAAAAAAVLLGVMPAVRAQPAPGFGGISTALPSRAHEALNRAIDCQRRGDYEQAAYFFQEAQGRQNDLTPDERQELAKQLQLNREAVARRRDGAAQLRLAEDALKAGRARDAEELLRKVIANQSLSPEDRRRALQLSEQLHNRGGAAPAIPPTVHTTAAPSGPGDSPLAAARAKLQQARLLLSQGNFDAAEQVANEVARGGVTFPPREDNPRKVLDEVARARSDPKALLTAARAALQAGDLDRAERLAHASKKAESALTVHFWGDSPSRVLEDVQAARTRKGPARPAEPGGVMDSVKNLFQANAGSAGGPPVTAQPGGPPPARPAPGAGAGPTNPEAEAARQLLQQGRKALAQGNFTEARRCAEQARARRWKPEWFDDNPDRLLADLGRAEARHQAPPAGGATQRPGTAPATAAAAGQTGKKEDPRALLAEGRLLWKEGKLDEAAKLAHRARQAQPPRRAWDAPWTLFDDTPEKLLKDIDKARAEHNREEAARLLAEARKMLDRNDLSGAERAAWRAEKLHGPYDIWDLGDRPQKVLADVQAAKARQRRTPVPPAPGALARNDRPPTPGSPLLPPAEDGGPAAGQQPGAGTAPAWNTRPAAAGTGHRDSNVQLAGGVGVTSGPGVGVQSAFVPPGGAGAEAARSRALQLMADARRLQAQGKLVEARHKALEAQHQNAAFGPDEDRPERILLEIGSLASKRMDLLMEKAGDCMATAQANPARWQEAEQNLVQARQLAVAFGLDAARIDGRLAQVRQARARGGVQPVNVQLPGQPAGQGARLLADARNELRSGKITLARRLAEDAYRNHAEVRAEAEGVLRMIDIEEHNQARLEAERTFDAAVSAFNRRDWDHAGRLFRSFDPRLLDGTRQARLKEYMSVPEMQPHAAPLAQASPAVGSPAPGGIKPTVLTGPGDVGRAVATDTSREAEFARQTAAMQNVKFQALQAKAQEVQRQAMERARAGDLQTAIELLNDFYGELVLGGDPKEGGLSPDQLALLRRPVDTRMQQYKTLLAQKKFEELQTQGKRTTVASRAQQALKEDEKQKKVAALMKQYNELFKEGKYQEAEVLAMQARELDPDNPVATAAVTMAKMQRRLVDYRSIKDQKEEYFLTEMNEAEKVGPAATHENPMLFDQKRWKKAHDRKPYDGVVGTKSEKEQEIERRLLQPVNLNFSDTPLSQVLDDLRTYQGVNIVVDKPALEEAMIREDSRVSIKLDNVSLKSALNLILGQVKLTWVIADDVLKVTTKEHARGQLVRRVFQVTDLVIPINNNPPPLQPTLPTSQPGPGGATGAQGNTTPYVGPFSMNGGQSVGQSLNGLGGAGAGAGGSQGPQAGQGWNVNRADDSSLTNTLIQLIKNTIQPQSWTDMGGPGSLDYFPLTHALVINQTPDIQEQIADLLQALRRMQDQEVAIEVRLITLTENFYERIGVDFNLNIKTDHITSRYEPQLVTQQFKPIGQINDFSPQHFISGLTPAGTFTSDLDIPIKASSFAPSIPLFGGFPNMPGSNGGLELGLAFLSDIQVYLFMEAAQGDVRTNIMQAPKLTMFNGSIATISISESQNFVTNVAIQQLLGQFQFVPQIQQIPNQVSLTLTAVISGDRRFVRVNVTPNIINLVPTVPLFPIVTPIFPVLEGGQPGPPVLFTQFIQQPSFTTIFVNTTVTVPDGGTVVMGGLKRLSEGRTEFGPPVLSKIPYVNRLFKNVGYGRDVESLLIMVTPRIIINEEEEFEQTGFRRPELAAP